MVAHNPVALALDRHQLRRNDGSPCVSVLVGDAAVARAAFRAWATAQQQPCAILTPNALTASFPVRLALLLESEPDAEAAARCAMHVATHAPSTPIALALTLAQHDALTTSTTPQTWRDLVRDGRIVLRGRRQRPAAPPQLARSAVELQLYTLLERDPRTRGHFRLNEQMPFRFGRRAAEIDLCARPHRLAVEIDGLHHFGSLERYRRDRRKDVLLQQHGYFVFRVAAADVGLPVVDAIAAILAQRTLT